MKPWIMAASAGLITALVPASLRDHPAAVDVANDDDRYAGGAGKTEAAMSPARRSVSEAEPAPSTRTRSASRQSLPKLSSMSTRVGFSVADIRAPSDRP